MSTRPSSRGPYAKGLARRAELLAVALDVLSTKGVRNSSLEEIATRVGLSRPGLLHYFGSREEFLVAVLRARYEADTSHGSRTRSAGRPFADQVVRAVLRQHRSPGLVRLDVSMAADATDPDHPGHLYLRERSRQLEAAYVQAITAEIEAGRVSATVDARIAAQQVNSLIDGLHVQWLIDPRLDVRTILTTALARLLPPGSDTPAHSTSPGPGAPTSI